MKKRVALTLLVAGLTGIGAGRAQEFYYGPRVGMNISSLTKTTYAKARVRAQLGGMAGYTINDLLGVQAEALYSMQGYKDNGDQDAKYALNYIKVPVLVKLYIIEGLNVEAGLSFNFLVGAKREGKEILMGGETATVSKNIKNDCQNFDLSIPIGINYQFKRWVDAGIRYDISTTRVPKQKAWKGRNSTWAITAGMRF